MGGWGPVLGGVLKALTSSSRSITASGSVVVLGDGARHSSDVVAVAICLDRQIRCDIIKIIILCISVIARPAFRPTLAPRALRVRGQRWQGRGDRSVINRRTEINIEKCALVAKLRA